MFCFNIYKPVRFTSVMPSGFLLYSTWKMETIDRFHFLFSCCNIWFRKQCKVTFKFDCFNYMINSICQIIFTVSSLSKLSFKTRSKQNIYSTPKLKSILQATWKYIWLSATELFYSTKNDRSCLFLQQEEAGWWGRKAFFLSSLTAWRPSGSLIL